MTARLALTASICALVALTAACDNDRSVRISSTSTSTSGDGKGVLKVVDTLQCPQTQGALTRKGTATDGGRTCTYTGPKGAEVILTLVSLDNRTVPQTLRTFEDRLKTSLPQAVAGLRASASASSTTEVRASSGASGDTATVRAPGVAVDASDDKASVRLPGMRIEADGDNASVRIGGFHIDANDSSGSVDINGSAGGEDVSVQARDNSTEVRAVSSGEATRASWSLSDNRPSPDGWRLVGYEARGPVGGPLVVATVRSRDNNRGRVFDDAKDLVTLNVGE
ncbi:hypothetical protein GCM10009422_15200 [Brevundimonas kwangchunensis]|uniref:Methyltransferase type 11 n=1 Tax=Brevundimonas kwangchunensis TaxID=322163 RepID=A0ABN1GVG1_9CAUL